MMILIILSLIKNGIDDQNINMNRYNNYLRFHN